MTKCQLLAIALLLVSGVAHAGDAEPICAGSTRLTPTNYPTHARSWIRSVTRRAGGPSSTLGQRIEAVRALGRDSESELCRWNRFLFVDFVLYYQQEAELGARDADGRRALLELRDQLHADWERSLSYRVKTGYVESENAPLRGEPIEHFVRRKSTLFGGLQTLASLFNRRPKDPIDAKVYNYLQARTPFSALMGPTVVYAAQDPRVGRALSCIKQWTRGADGCPSGNIEQAAEDCAAEVGFENAADEGLFLLGAFASQRMYLVRDLKGWLEQNLSETDYGAAMAAIQAGAEVHFRAETLAARCGVDVLYPTEIAGRAKSAKAYHFWSVAHIARWLRGRGVTPLSAKAAALRPARRYKKMIMIPGVVFNLLLGQPLAAGTVGDYGHVKEEQELGALWGAGLKIK
ncbi:MAG TPA: hypothetical protein VL588_02030 [Bdellovibrionota bacterium]|nr:hypothetical protein [Bdellovibrionota bacterium]